MAEVTSFLTPPGRMVGGDCFEPQTKDADGKPLLIKNGPNAGQPRVDYYIGVAVPKTDPGWPELWAKICNEARVSFPTLHDATGNCINPQFAFKVTDGDGQIPNTKGIKPCDREGYPGHWILNFSGGFAPKCFATGGEAVITDPTMLKRGYYIRVYGTVKGNGSQSKPGVFLNHRMIELIGYGDEIVSGPDGKQIFGAAPVALPAGASTTPVAPAASIAQPGPGPTQGDAVAAPLVPAQGPGPASAGIQPAPDFLNPSEIKYRTADGVWSQAQLEGAGYTLQQIQALPRA